MNRWVISLNISLGTYRRFVLDIIQKAVMGRSSYICVANVHMCIEAYDDPEFARVVNGADLITPDGMPLAKAIKILYGEHQDRVAGMDLLPDLLKEAESRGLSCFVYGGSESMLQKSEEYISATYPGLRCGYHSPPFRPLTAQEEQADCDRINALWANLVCGGLGCVIGKRWIANVKGTV